MPIELVGLGSTNVFVKVIINGISNDQQMLKLNLGLMI